MVADCLVSQGQIIVAQLNYQVYLHLAHLFVNFAHEISDPLLVLRPLFVFLLGCFRVLLYFLQLFELFVDK